VAGVRALAQRGVIKRGERVVAVLTGHLLKDPGTAEPRPGSRQDDSRALTPEAAMKVLADVTSQ
jgi:threonine synthase